MINNNLLIGNYVVANFKIISELSKSINNYVLERNGNGMILSNVDEKVKLIPLSESDELKVKEFGEETIYRVESIGNHVILMLYKYSETIKRKLESEKIRIHLSREAEKELCSNGYAGFKLRSTEEILDFLRVLFISNKSIFIFFNSNDPNSFQMFGKKHRASLRMEGPSLYVIDMIYPTREKDYQIQLTQVYGDIDFVLWSDSISFQGNKLPLKSFQTNEIFKAWEEYMDFVEELYKIELENYGFLKYEKIYIEGDKLIFKLSQKVTEEKIRNTEFEFMSSYNKAAIIDLPDNVDEILLNKANLKNSYIYLGLCMNEVFYEDKIVFDIPKYGFTPELTSFDGLLYVSNHSIEVEQKRRRRVLAKINSRQNDSASIIMRLSSAGVVDDQLGSRYDPINPEVLKKMFNKKSIVLKENYREALSIALNTPDIALIQGPPGTGKTTLIKGIIARLNAMSKNFKILVSSEQHEALFNVIEKISDNKLIPPFISSRQFEIQNDEDQNLRFEYNVIKFQENISIACEEILKKTNKDDKTSKLIENSVFILQQIGDNKYSKEIISKSLDNLKYNLISLGFYDSMTEEFFDLNKALMSTKSFDNNDDYELYELNIIRKIEAQRTNIKDFMIDGDYQMKSLQDLLKSNNKVELLLPNKYKVALLSHNKEEIVSIFDEYVKYVENLKKIYTQKIIIDQEKSSLDLKAKILNINKKLSESIKGRPKNFFDIVESFMYRLNDIESASEVVKKYTSVIGSTCAQAEKSGEITEIQKYDYVIVDEAARVNPIDIMIPLSLGTKVILVGDHKQLPHYVEEKIIKEFAKNNSKCSNFNEKLLTKSLFQVIYENLEKAHKDGRIKFKRTTQINEQHRMHPTIGNFISSEFYEGTIENSDRTNENSNDYGLFKEKNVVWINVDNTQGAESKINYNYTRESEVAKIIDLIKELKRKNPERNLNIGIISFYKGQVNLLNKKLEENFSKTVLESIYCNTVDSYQGKEFDIVILSGVRSNNQTSPERSLGFIHHSPSRINVALSRARRLLIVVADENTYKKNTHFKNFIDYVNKEGNYE